jgi:dTMP kinase
MHVLITIDGVDGVGKTSVAKMLATELGFIYYKSPGFPFNEMRDEVNLRAGPIERFAFYRLATSNDSMVIKKLLESNSVVCDRYIASTIAYHVTMDKRIHSLVNRDDLLVPNLSVLLSADTLVRNKRILARAEQKGDHSIERSSAFLDNVAEEFSRMKMFEVNTSNISIQEVVHRIRLKFEKG